MNLQPIINQWQRETFPDATEFDYLDKCFEELSELRDALNNGSDTQACMLEAADVYIALTGLMGCLGGKLDDAAQVKMGINFQRVWQKDDEGQYHHV